jgi:hypothetical protein
VSFEADTTQLRQLGDQLRAAGAQLDNLEGPNTQAARIVEAAAHPPRRSGTLAASSRAGVSAGGVTFASTARYWTFVHWGAPRRNIRARPWWTEALTRTTTEVLAVYAKHATSSLEPIG